jgi:hypothetical protein
MEQSIEKHESEKKKSFFFLQGKENESVFELKYEYPSSKYSN